MFFADPEAQLTYKVANAPIALFPYPHIFVRDVFPEDFYRELRRNLPPPAGMKSLVELGRVAGNYPAGRAVLPLTREHIQALEEPARGFWTKVEQWLVSGAFTGAVLKKFDALLAQRFQTLDAAEFRAEALVVRDGTNYALGPHTDTPAKVLSFLFYLPADDSRAHLGTSVYLPKEPDFTSAGSEPYYPFDRFRRLMTMPYVPNALFAFMKTPTAFHGVEPITDGNPERCLLLFDVKHRPAPPDAGAVSTKFSF